MKEPKTPGPAGYPITDAAEVDAVNVFRGALDSKKFKADIRERDKHPNIDGYVELIDEKRKPVGKIEVQIKKLPDGSMTFACPTTLIAYTDCTPLPVLLICVDTTAKKAYWRHITHADLIGKEGQGSVSMTFGDPEDAVSVEGSHYNKWLSLAKDACEGVAKYKALKEIARIATPLIGQKSEEIGQIQIFIDELNGLLDRDFICLKRASFPGVWKVGIAVQHWTPEWAQYALFAIEAGRNEPLIKQIDPKADIFSNPQRGFFATCGTSRIAKNPAGAARELVFKRLCNLIKVQGLPFCGDLLRAEYLFTFIDQYGQCLGLPNKDRYEPAELYRGLNEYFPQWCNAARSSMAWYPPHIPYFDPGIARMLLGRSISEQVKKAVEQRLPIAPIDVGSPEFSFIQLHRAVEHLRANGMAIERPFLRGTAKGAGRYVWSRFTDEEAFSNVRTLYEQFLPAYRSFVSQNGMDYSSLRPFRGVAKVLYFFTPARPPREEWPLLEEFQLLGSGEFDGDPVVSVMRGPSGLQPKRNSSGDLMIEWDGQSYRVHSHHRGVADTIFQNNPIRTTIFKIFIEQLRRRLTVGQSEADSLL